MRNAAIAAGLATLNAAVANAQGPWVFRPPAGLTNFEAGWDIMAGTQVVGNASMCQPAASYQTLVQDYIANPGTFPFAIDSCVYETRVSLSFESGKKVSGSFSVDSWMANQKVTTSFEEPMNEIHMLPREMWKEDLPPPPTSDGYYHERHGTIFNPQAQFEVMRGNASTDPAINFHLESSEKLEMFVVLDEPIPQELLGDLSEPCENSCTCSLRTMQQRFDEMFSGGGEGPHDPYNYNPSFPTASPTVFFDHYGTASPTWSGTMTPSPSSGGGAGDDGFHPMDMLVANFTGWATCETSACRTYIFAFFNFYGELDPTTAQDATTISEYLGAGTTWIGRDTFVAAWQYLFSFIRLEYVADKGMPQEACQLEFDACLSDAECMDYLLIKVLIRQPADQEQFLLQLETRPNANMAQSMELFHQLNKCMPLVQKPQLILPLNSIPCACQSYSYGHAHSEPMYDKFGLFGYICHHSNVPVGTLVLGTKQIDFDQVDQSGEIQTSSFPVSPPVVQEMMDCVNGVGNCTSTAEASLHGLKSGYKLFDPTQVCYPEESRPECAMAEVSVPPHPALEYAQAFGVLPYVVVRSFYRHWAYAQYSSGGYYETYDKMVLQVDSSSPDSFQEAEIALVNENLWQANLTVFQRPMVPEGVTEENCHIGCHCANLFLAHEWDAMMMMHSKFPFLSVPVEHVPCACSPLSDMRTSHVEPEKKWISEQMRYAIKTKIQLCTTGTIRLRKVHEVSGYQIKPNYKYLCDCYGDMENCRVICKLSRGPWAWTCDNFDGQVNVERYSQEYYNMQGMCYN